MKAISVPNGSAGFHGKLKHGRGTPKQLVSVFLKGTAGLYRNLRTAKKQTLQAVILGKVALESVIYSDGWRGYSGLVDVGYSKHLRVNHGQNEFADGAKHINGIESFRSFTKKNSTA